jgi:hypothetical protein
MGMPMQGRVSPNKGRASTLIASLIESLKVRLVIAGSKVSFVLMTD